MDGKTLWNGTLNQEPMWNAFHIAWYSNNLNGTSGNASCLLVQALYDVELRLIALSTSFSLIF
jgi:hypothetical protein